jgi:hypothetical protein
VCEKEEERFSPEEDEGTKGGEGMLPPAVPSILYFLCVKKRKKGFRAKKTKGQRVEKGCFLLVCLRFFVSFVCEKKKERFSSEEDEGTKGGEGMLPPGVPFLCFLCV